MDRVKRMLAALLGICLLAGCGIEEQPAGKEADLEYTLVAQADIPQELLTQIEGAKTEEIYFTADEADLFRRGMPLSGEGLRRAAGRQQHSGT